MYFTPGTDWVCLAFLDVAGSHHMMPVAAQQWLLLAPCSSAHSCVPCSRSLRRRPSSRGQSVGPRMGNPVLPRVNYSRAPCAYVLSAAAEHQVPSPCQLQ